MPWIAYPGSTVQQNYAEDLKHGYLTWEINDPSDFRVSFNNLPNPKPFVTLNWTGDISDALTFASSQPTGSRFRIKSNIHIGQRFVGLDKELSY